MDNIITTNCITDTDGLFREILIKKGYSKNIQISQRELFICYYDIFEGEGCKTNVYSIEKGIIRYNIMDSYIMDVYNDSRIFFYTVSLHGLWKDVEFNQLPVLISNEYNELYAAWKLKRLRGL